MELSDSQQWANTSTCWTEGEAQFQYTEGLSTTAISVVLVLLVLQQQQQQLEKHLNTIK